ncbi:MAG TPA: hypothetical protein VKU41_32870, partial [Polyangiaceae bacterium]|nr:hypothetical protein [Polyangiaceae bacterium]
PLTNFNVGAGSSHCQLSATLYYCSNPATTVVPTPPANTGMFIGYRTSGSSTNAFAPGLEAFLPTPLSTSGCVSASNSWVLPVTANTAYDFGCAIILNSASPSGTGVDCSVTAVCF